MSESNNDSLDVQDTYVHWSEGAALLRMKAIASEGGGDPGAEKPLLVRYVDDFVMVHSNLEELQRAARRVTRWLAAMGLRLHVDKTRITHTLTPYRGLVGFDFLGFTIRHSL